MVKTAALRFADQRIATQRCRYKNISWYPKTASCKLQPMSKKFRITLVIFFVLIAGGAAVAWYMFNKPRRDVAQEQGIVIPAGQLVSEYQADETAANTKYLDKPIEVTGTVGEVKNNQDGKTTILLTGTDPMTGVFCTLKDATANITPGSTVTIKGICSGMLSDVRLREAILVK